ncbi:MAG TPA: TatD family hydrolase [Anaerolineales bacterium]|nr:TatD family hydrolase [Anaerolineales bacterium]
MLTDTHCHLDLNKFDGDRDLVIQRALEAAVGRILIPALDWESSLAAVELARAYPGLFAAVGFHPTDLEKWSDSSLENLRKLVSESNGLPMKLPEPALAPPDKIVAIGEIGLDYYWIEEPDQRAQQRNILRQQLEFAQEMNKPVVIHMREEHDQWFGQASIDLLEILTEWQRALNWQNHPLAEKPGVLHSYNGNLETAQKALALNFYIGVTGPVTYKNAEMKRQIIRQLPLERLLIETDSPFLTPVPHRGKRNEPAFVAYIADKIAEIHMTTREQVAEITSANAARLFGWGG